MKRLAAFVTAMMLLSSCTTSRYFDRSTLREMGRELDRSKTAIVSLKNGNVLPEAGVFLRADTLFYPGIDFLMLDQVKKITVMEKYYGTYKVGLIFCLLFGSLAASYGYLSGDDRSGKTSVQKAWSMGLTWGLGAGLFGGLVGNSKGYPVYYYYTDTLGAIK